MRPARPGRGAGGARAVWRSRPMRVLRGAAAGAALLLPSMACDPVYCATLHVDVETASGEPAPAGTEVTLSEVVPHREVKDSVVAYPIDVRAVTTAGRPVRLTGSCLFLESAGTFRVDALGGSTTLRDLPLEWPDAANYPLRVVEGVHETHAFKGD